MVFTTPLGLLSSSMLIQMWIGQVIQLIDVPSQVFVSCWVLLLSLGVARSRTWFPVPVPRLRIVFLLTPPTNLSGFDSFWLTWMFHSLLPLFFIVIIVVLSTLLIKMSSINAPSTLRSIAITLASISRKAISSYSPSPLPSNLLISSPKLNRLVVFEIQYPNSNWLPPYHLEFEGGCQYITQFSLAYRAQPSIQYLWYSHITCTSHILNLYEALYCTTLFIQNIQTIQSFSLTLIFLTYIYIFDER